MGKQTSKKLGGTRAIDLFPTGNKRKHPRLFLPKYLREEADRLVIAPAELERVGAILANWANMSLEGKLARKETELDAEFLQRIFGDALGYRSVTESPHDYHREKNPSVPGAGIADGSLGHFVSGKAVSPSAIIELKGATTDLDHDKPQGRTPVQQLWDYINQLPDTPWGIVSNYDTVRLYHKGSPARAYEEFTVNDFLDPQRVREFYYLFERQGLIGSRVSDSRALKLLRRTQNQQREVGGKLYAYYADQREQLIDELMDEKGMSQDVAIHAAQRLLDRVIFMAFCEDRGLLPEKLIESTWKNVPPLARATNPRWRNFLDAFHAIDKGHVSLDLPTGYNGGLFKHDEVVDNLDLEDRWADVFKNIGGYDFREEGEISVDVLGHIFERSITELEKLRVVGLFGKQGVKAAAAMPKSAERKRFGIYYTPPQFTRLIVEETLGKLIAERVETLPDLKQRVAELRKLKVVDPACGSGAFLIAAYERLEDAYEEIARQMRIAGHLQEALNLTNEYPDSILSDNLYGVDLSAESVEITQLALWIRSARRGRTLADLSGNIRRGNSLIRDKSVHAEAFDWHAAFPDVFADGGFDAVIGNPPWERIKLQKREFFSNVPEVLGESHPEKARKLIERLSDTNPELSRRWEAALSAADRYADYFRREDTFALTSKGDLNTYMLFAELALHIVAPHGRVGILVPSGIATDHTTRGFFTTIMGSRALTALYDFENRELLFPDVDGRFKFSVLLMNGPAIEPQETDFVFFAHKVEDLANRERHIPLSAKELKLLNPNTRTCPIFRTRRDAALVKRAYRTVPILWDRNRKEGGNPWSVTFFTMFHQSADAAVFTEPDELRRSGYQLNGNVWSKSDDRFLPCYEAKMFGQFDHRGASAISVTSNFLRQGQREATSVVEHQNPEFYVLPRWWAPAARVEAVLREFPGQFPLAFKNVTSSTNQRTMIATFLPRVGIVHSAPYLFTGAGFWPRRACCLLANLNSLAYDWIARQKVGGNNLSYFIIEQIPTLPPDAYDEKCPWAKSKRLEDWIADRVLKLTCTADDMRPLAEAAGFTPGVWKWKEDERAHLRAELDAAYFHLYQLSRDDVEHVLGTFQGIAKEDDRAGGEGRTRQLILQAYDQFSS